MEDFDIFTDEIQYTKPAFKNILHQFVGDVPSTPSGPNYESGRKLLGEECLSEGLESECAFHFSESASPALRTLAVYREEQLQYADDRFSSITNYVKPINDLVEANPLSKEDEKLLEFLPDCREDVNKMLKECKIQEVPFYSKYLRFSSDNNVNNFCKILQEFPKQWTIIQLTAPHNPNENLKPFTEYKKDINSIYISLLTNDYIDVNTGPITVQIPANTTKGEEKPLFVELYSLLDENYNTINSAQSLNNKRLVMNYWNRREQVDLRMKSVINVMHKEWLGGWSSLLTGKLVDSKLRDKVIALVDKAINDWGFIKLTQKQRILLYNLLEHSAALPSQQFKSCIRKILTEHGNIGDIKQIHLTECENCNNEFKFPNELCLKCLSVRFEKIHNVSLVDGIKAFSEVAGMIKNSDDGMELKKAKRFPVILIVDEMLDTFPWEMLPIIHQHPVTRVENIHFLYKLYKVHEDNIVDGYFNLKPEVGRYVIDPEKNLDRMEKRMTAFVKYWCSSWSGYISEPPPAEKFLEYLTESDMFLYCGHGDGCYFANGGANGAGIEGVSARTAAILSGCSSVRLTRPPGRYPAAAAHHHLHVAHCPIVVGMLWEVTDLEVDKVVSTLVSLYVPTTASVHWRNVGKSQWSSGVIDTNVEEKETVTQEKDFLQAISRARSATNFVMIASSLVARGLPVRIPEE